MNSAIKFVLNVVRELSESIIEEATAKIKQIFIIMQDRFKNAEKRQPISLIDALAFTNHANSDVLAVVAGLERQLRQLWKEQPDCSTCKLDCSFALLSDVDLCPQFRNWKEKVEKHILGKQQNANHWHPQKMAKNEKEG